MNHSFDRANAVRLILARATVLHDAGHLAEADALARDVLTFQPAHPDALNLIGSVALRGGSASVAAEILSRAAQAAPRSVPIRINLGHAMKALGRAEDAIQSYRAAVGLKP